MDGCINLKVGESLTNFWYVVRFLLVDPMAPNINRNLTDNLRVVSPTRFIYL
jgi:hypothetical protein